MKEGIEIIGQYEILQKALKYIIENSTSNYIPYHNLNHELTVLKYCDYIATEEGIFDDQKLPLLLAAMFHDVDHSSGKYTDDINVQNAKHQFTEFALQQKLDTKIGLVALDIISATQYPYVILHKDLTKLQSIIRDADLMQTFEPNWIQQIALGLSAELKMTVHEFVPKQIDFLKASVLSNQSAINFKQKNWNRLLQQVRILEISLNS